MEIMLLSEQLKEKLKGYKTLDVLNEINNYIEENEFSYPELEKMRWIIAAYDYEKKFGAK